MDRSAHTIGVVDDHEATRYVAVKLLRALGYAAAEAETGEDALTMAGSGRASALLLDVNLPDVNGVKVCEHLKASAHPIPVVLMSAVYLDDLHRDIGLGAGADAYLTAPLSAQELGAVFDRLLGVAAPASGRS